MSIPDFDFPSRDVMLDEAAWRMWLISALQRIHAQTAETAYLQKEANGRASKMEQRTACLEAALRPLDLLTLRLTTIERVVFGAVATVLIGVLTASMAVVLR